MTVWVALLRGVNVGGITIRSAALREVFVELGFDDVVTVLASGNVVFTTSRADSVGVKLEIEAALRRRFDYDAWIVLRTLQEVDAVARAFPFDANDLARQPMVIFGSEDTALAELAEAAASIDSDVDPVRAGDRVIFWNPATGTSTTTPFAKLLARQRYKATTTSRNLRTLFKVLAAGNR